MEFPEFLEELEKSITNAGSNKVWKRTIGEYELWFTPLTLPAQEKVNESLSRGELGANVITESKRVSLSHAIVGINGFDLQEYRSGVAVFPITNKEGKKVKVTLDKYLYEKMGTWGGQFVDDVFSVYADLIESHQKENLKDVRFENSKDPKLELLELEARASELRSQMNMPAMVEAGSLASKTTKEDDDIEELPTVKEIDPDVGPDFDPFTKVKDDGVPEYVEAAEKNFDDLRGRARAGHAKAEALKTPEVVKKNLEPLPRTPMPEDELFNGNPVAKENQVQLPPVRPDDILEKPADKTPVAPPVIDRPPTNINPRFSRPVR
jgi:hypothetical protein